MKWVQFNLLDCDSSFDLENVQKTAKCIDIFT